MSVGGAEAVPLLEAPGPWRHRYVAAHGARFHVTDARPDVSDPVLVLLLHGFPQHWWAWRHQVPALAQAGFHAAAADLRGYGGSDKTPRGYDPFTLAGDVAGLVKALGEPHAILVGQGFGGYVAWAAAALHPAQVRALCVVSAPHPLELHAALWRRPGRATLAHLLSMQMPVVPERRLMDTRRDAVGGLLGQWAAPGSGFPDEEARAQFAQAMRLWPAPHCALEYHRWLLRSRGRSDGRAFDRLMRPAVSQPVLDVRGAQDPLLPAASQEHTPARVAGPFRQEVLAGAGHFPAEECPADLTGRLLDWLRHTVG